MYIYDNQIQQAWNQAAKRVDGNESIFDKYIGIFWK